MTQCGKQSGHASSQFSRATVRCPLRGRIVLAHHLAPEPARLPERQTGSDARRYSNHGHTENEARTVHPARRPSHRLAGAIRARRPTPASIFRISSRWRRSPSAGCSTCCSRRTTTRVWTVSESAIDRVHYVAWMEPYTLLSALSGYTKNIGLVCTASTSFEQPYSVARKFATLDLISGGRSGWNVVTSGNETEAQNFSKEPHLPKAERYKRGARIRRGGARPVGFLGRGRLHPQQGDRHLHRPLEDARAQPSRPVL